jgi:hypothetical protein
MQERQRKLAAGGALALVLLVTFAACVRERRVRIRPDPSLDESSASFLRYASSSVEGFTDPDGKPCARFSGEIRNNLIGWQPEDDDGACNIDTMETGLRPAILELRWQAVIPNDGSYELVPAGYGLGAWGSALSRGSYHGDYFAQATLFIDAQAPSCSGSWALQLARAAVTGPWSRQANFSGWITIPAIVLSGCRGGDTVEARVRLVGETNRGAVNVDWFGFSAVADQDKNRIFALREQPNARQR